MVRENISILFLHQQSFSYNSHSPLWLAPSPQQLPLCSMGTGVFIHHIKLTEKASTLRNQRWHIYILSTQHNSTVLLKHPGDSCVQEKCPVKTMYLQNINFPWAKKNSLFFQIIQLGFFNDLFSLKRSRNAWSFNPTEILKITNFGHAWFSLDSDVKKKNSQMLIYSQGKHIWNQQFHPLHTVEPTGTFHIHTLL